MPPLNQETWVRDFPQGYRETSARYGTLEETLEFRVVDGFLYNRYKLPAEPEGGAEGAPPSRLMLRLAFLLHPVLRARRRIARELFEKRPWLEDFRLWDEQVKPEQIGTHRALLRVPIAELTDAGLFEHIAACHALLRRTVFNHGRFSLPAVMPSGEFLMQTSEWTGLQPARLLLLLRGFSPLSANRLSQTRALVESLRASPSAAARLSQEGDPGKTLQELMEHPEVGPAARDYLDLVGYRLMSGYDMSSPMGFEHPQVLLVGIRAALEAPEPSAGSEMALLPEVRDRVPQQHRDRFDALLAEARRLYALRDERVLYGDCWSSGVLRRAVLHAGERLARRGLLEAPEHFMEAELVQMRALLMGQKGPSAEELAARARDRQRNLSDVPALRGPPPPPLPVVAWFPEDMRRAVAVALTLLRASEGEGSQGGSESVRGVGVSRGTYMGPVRLVKGPEDLHRIRPGDVLVTSSTSPAFNVVMPMLGALVTDWGGTLSHAAIIAREYGIPGVVGTRDATRRLSEGVRVTVDGDAGEVRVAG